MKIPQELKYTKDHVWVRISGNTAIVGITEFAQSELGEIVFVEIETEGDIVSKENVFGTVEAVKTVSDLYMPLTGKVLEVNKDLNAKPDLVNSDPYGEGWMIKISIEDAAQINTLLSAADYKAMIA